MADVETKRKRKLVEEYEKEFNTAEGEENKRQKKIVLDLAVSELTSHIQSVQNVTDLQSIEVAKMKEAAILVRQGSSWTENVPGSMIAEAVLWKTVIQDKKIKRSVVQFDQLLVANRLFISELRWLQLKFLARKDTSTMDDIITMRKSRKYGANDLELPYHPLLLLFYQAASAGQAGLEFLAEDKSLDEPREDIRGMINGKRLLPQECKAECVWNNGEEEVGIDRNSDAFGKLLKVRER